MANSETITTAYDLAEALGYEGDLSTQGGLEELRAMAQEVRDEGDNHSLFFAAAVFDQDVRSGRISEKNIGKGQSNDTGSF